MRSPIPSAFAVAALLVAISGFSLACAGVGVPAQTIASRETQLVEPIDTELSEGNEFPEGTELTEVEYDYGVRTRTDVKSPGGAFQAEADSLGLEEFLHLSRGQMDSRLTGAFQWIKKGRERRVPDLAQHYFATAVGLCPLLPEGWALYADTQLAESRPLAARLLLLNGKHALQQIEEQGLDQTVLEAVDLRLRELHFHFAFMLGIVAYNLGEREAAILHVEEALDYQPTHPRANLLLARSLVGVRRYEEARLQLEITERSAKGDRNIVREAQAILGVLEMETGNLIAAAKAFGNAAKMGMKGGVFSNDRGRLSLRRGRLEEAERHFKDAIHQLPQLMEARNNLAVSLRRQGRLEEADTVLRDALRIDREYAPVHFNLAEVCAQRHREREEGANSQAAQLADDAREHYGKALELDYQVAISLERRAMVALRVGDLEAAEADLLRLAGHPDAAGRVIYLLGRTKKDQNEPRIAGQLFRMALNRGYDNAALHSDLGELLLRRADLDGAREHLSRAVAMDDRLIRTRLNLCVVLLQLEDYTAADVILRQAEKLAPEDPYVQAQRVVLDSMRGGS